MTTYKFRSEDNDNCRVYYRADTGGLFCYQLDRPGVFIFLRCSRDGEPSHPVAPAGPVPPPPGETKIGEELRAFLGASQPAPEDASESECTCVGVCHCYGWSKANGD